MSVSAPTRSDPVARAAGEIAGGPAGRFLSRGTGRIGTLPVLVLLAVLTMAGAVLAKQHCRAEGWSSPDQFWHACYSDTAVLYSSAQLGGPDRPSLRAALGDGGLGQAPLTGAAMWAVSGVVHAVTGEPGEPPDAAAMRTFFDVSAVVMSLVFFVAVAATAVAVGRRRRWDAAQVALAPVVLASGLISYDLLATAAVALTLLAWSRRRPVAAGVFAAAAICSRPVTALLLAALFGLCLRAGTMRAWLVTASTALAGWVLVRVLLFAAPLDTLGQTWTAWRSSTPGYGSVWLVPQLVEQALPGSPSRWYEPRPLSASVSTLLTLVALALVVAATLWLATTPRYRPRVAHVMLFALAAGLLAIKALPPQASLLLLPVLAASALPWRDHLIWATAEISYFVAVWMFIPLGEDPYRALPAPFYLVLLLARCAAIGWLAVQAVRLAVDPRRDPVRVPGDPDEGPADADDPAGGLLDRRPDAGRARPVPG